MKVETGVQTYTYRKFPIEKCIEMAAGLGLDAIELWPGQLPVDSPAEKIDEIKGLVAGAGMRVCGTGVVGFDADRAKTEQTLEYAKTFGVDYVSCSFDPADGATVEHLVAEAGKRELLLAIHNHGPSDRMGEPEAVRDAAKDFPELLGACVDTGHFLRSGRSPEEAVEIIGNRVHAVHLKDFLDEEHEVEPGTGKLDFAKFFAVLKQASPGFNSAFVLEYEADADDPTPSMKSAVASLKEALAGW